MELDARDIRLLTRLQRDCRMSNADLAEAVGMSASAVWRRVRTFEEAGIISRYGAVVEAKPLGLAFEAIVQVSLTRHDPDLVEAFIRAIGTCDEVRECYAVTGQADYHLRVLCADLEAFNRFLDGFLFRLPAVASAQTNLVLRQIKRGGPLVPPAAE